MMYILSSTWAILPYIVSQEAFLANTNSHHVHTGPLVRPNLLTPTQLLEDQRDQTVPRVVRAGPSPRSWRWRPEGGVRRLISTSHAHLLMWGLKGRLSTRTVMPGRLPAGLAEAEDFLC